jgi:transcriptional regulatory protein LevR
VRLRQVIVTVETNTLGVLVVAHGRPRASSRHQHAENV